MKNEAQQYSLRASTKTYGREDLANILPLANPLSIHIDPASICNFRCSFCPTGDPHLIKKTGRAQTMMPMDLYQKIINDIDRFKSPIKSLRLYKDGEPLLNPHLADMVGVANKLKKTGQIERIEFTTNGSKLSSDISDRLIANGLDRIIFSIEGVSEQKYWEFAKVKIDLKKLIDQIAYFYQQAGDQCHVHIKTISQNLGPDESQKFFDLFGPHCHQIDIEPVINGWSEFEAFNDKIKPVDLTDYAPVVHKTICPYLFYSLVVNSDGSVSTCCVDWNRKLIIGHTKNQTLQEIWDGVKMRMIRQTHIDKGCDSMKQCRNCIQKDFRCEDNIDSIRDQLRQHYC
ncbi:MAG: radical SAM protein [Pseudomonadota bacterium]